MHLRSGPSSGHLSLCLTDPPPLRHPQVVLKSKDDQVTVIGAGVTLHEALAAADLLKKGEEGRTQTVLDRMLTRS